jgi:hypothetical protein
MKTDDKSGTANAKGCIVTGAKNGSTKVETRVQDVRGPMSTMENIDQKKVTAFRKGMSAQVHG